MKLTTAILLIAALLFVAPPTSPVHASSREAAVEFFYVDLQAYGHWVDHPIYGMVWVPDSRQPGWAPYSEGRWVWTRDYGWYWDSDEEFGWATYHYGRWIFTSDLGWVWVPDEVWGPAWVDWRYDEDGYVGWAPMPPEYQWRNGVFVSASVDLGTPKYASRWLFVSQHDFAEGRISGHRIPAARNRELIGASVRITNYASANGEIFNRSVDPAVISAKTKIRIPTLRTSLASSFEERARLKASGSIPVYRPRIVSKGKLDLDASSRIVPNLDGDIKSRDSIEMNGPPSGMTPGQDGVGASAGGVPDRPLGAGIGGGIGVGIGGGGIGGGGGLRLGR